MVGWILCTTTRGAWDLNSAQALCNKCISEMRLILRSAVRDNGWIAISLNGIITQLVFS